MKFTNNKITVVYNNKEITLSAAIMDTIHTVFKERYYDRIDYNK